MSSDAIEAVFNAPPQVIFLTLIGVLYIIKESVTLVRYLMETLGLVSKRDIEKKNITDTVSNLTECLSKLENKVDKRFDNLRDDIYERMDKIQNDMDNVQNASKEELGDKINLKFKIYFKQGYIPFDEYDDFIRLHDAYKGVGGNHSGDARFEKCIKILPIIDDSTEEMRIRLTEQNPIQTNATDCMLNK